MTASGFRTLTATSGVRAMCCVAVLLLLAWPSGARSADEHGAALDYLNRGVVLFRDGDAPGAVQNWTEAIRLAQRIGDVSIEVQALMRRGEAYRVDGYFRDADGDLRSALRKAEAAGSQQMIAEASGILGALELAASHSEAAEILLRRSRDLTRNLGDRAGLAAAANNLGDLYVATGRLSDAVTSYTEAVASARAAGDEILAATAEINLARLSAQKSNLTGAADLLTRAIDRLEAAAPSYGRGLALISAGSIALEQGDKSSRSWREIARRAYQAAAQTAAALHNPRLTALAQGGLGRLAIDLGQPADAARRTDQALVGAQRVLAPDLSFRLHWQRARLARERGQEAAALESYRLAIANLQSIRQDIPIEYHDGKSSYRVTFGPLYREFTDLLLRRAAAAPAEAPALTHEARDTIEQLKESELQDYFRDSCVANFEGRRQSIEQVAPGAAVIYPISLPDRLELLVSFGAEQRQFTVPVSEVTLAGEVKNFRELLEKRTTNEFLIPAREIYNQLIRPIEPVLVAHRIDTLVIVPDPVLRVIPFAALHDGRAFLMERYATVIAPSMHLIDPKPLAAGPRLALVLGVSEGVQGFVALPNVPNELSAVRQIEGGTALVDSAFSSGRFASELKTTPYNIVHIASHAQFATDPSQTFVLSFDAPLTMNTLETDIKFGERRENALELLVLSACETASGDDRAALGLAGVALKAGARSAVASLWYIDDEASSDLVVDFYRGLHESGLSKARALQRAQQHLAASLSYAHPAYWAPFLLIGNWL